jgi:hypothetical protein
VRVHVHVHVYVRVCGPSVAILAQAPSSSGSPLHPRVYVRRAGMVETGGASPAAVVVAAIDATVSSTDCGGSGCRSYCCGVALPSSGDGS